MNKLLTIVTIVLLVIIVAEVYFIGIKPLSNNNLTTKSTPNQQIKVNDPDKQEGINNIVRLLDGMNFDQFELFRTVLTGTNQNNYQSITLIKEYRGKLRSLKDSPGYLDPKSKLAYAIRLALINNNNNKPLVIYYQQKDLEKVIVYKNDEEIEISELKQMSEINDLLITEEYNFATASLNKATITVL